MSYPFAWFPEFAYFSEAVGFVVLHQVDQKGELWRRLDVVLLIFVLQDLEVFHLSARPHCRDRDRDDALVVQRSS